MLREPCVDPISLYWLGSASCSLTVRLNMTGAAAWTGKDKGEPGEAAMIRIAITQAAFDALAATLPLGSVAYETELDAKGERLIWLEEIWVNKLAALHGLPRATAT